MYDTYGIETELINKIEYDTDKQNLDKRLKMFIEKANINGIVKKNWL